MASPYITIGSPTTGGGQVISANTACLIEGKPVACVGDKATCPKHKTVTTIVAGDNKMVVMGKPAAQHNSPLACGCKCIGNQNLVVGHNGSSSSKSLLSSSNVTNNFVDTEEKSYSQRFQLKDELSDEILANICYEIEINGRTIHGKTDQNGFTQEVISDKEEQVVLRVIAEDHEHGHNCCKRRSDA